MSEPWRERVEVGDAVLMLGDCRSILPTLQFDGLVTDPPYGIAHRHSGTGSVVTNCRNGRFLRASEAIDADATPFDPGHLLGRPLLLFGANHFYARLPDGGTFHVWDKHCGRGTDDTFSDAEFFWTSWRRSSEVVRYLWKGVLQDGEKGERRHHPSQKPIAVMEACVAMLPGSSVCDPYMGSGTTGVACARLGRRFIGIELAPKHFATAVRRITEAQRQGRLFDPPRQRAEQLALLP